MFGFLHGRTNVSSVFVSTVLHLLENSNRCIHDIASIVTDENVQLRNFGIKATESNIISLSQDQRTFTWTSTGRKLMTVPFDEHPYSALAAWFKTDEGVEMYKSIAKKLK